ncbi:nitrate/nitrite two-component system sensor histidine kinase NarQ [Vibrio splendidus]|uniref:nitrate/nitrite two-component system sensor histidine kinase NarQ n=1 Tax=Vibrio splendidus TaxID=29497 RepID=UPI00148B7191|nr:nitrate/nitrite two-component system sensor histidine kinase NarQ [Vibrio splendidus]NOJ09882.1 nitrate/nitrite two-component system sensor histidine kinase NarQ [Vibrio splendidus]
MLIKPVSSVTSTIAKSLLSILLLSVATTGFAIFTLASSLNDAEAVNVAGSMRMQSYRLAHDIQIESVDYDSHIREFERSLYSPSMTNLVSWEVPTDITEDYYLIIGRWHELKQVLSSEDRKHYLVLVENFVAEIDGFVFKLQEFSEDKLIKLAWAGGIGLGGILVISLFVVHFVRKQVVKPLHALVGASQRIKNSDFEVELKVTNNNELGILTKTFNSMAKDLGALYRNLEDVVDAKTIELQNANQSLQALYHSSQELTVTRIAPENFRAILQHLVSLEGIESLRLEIVDNSGRSLIMDEGYDSKLDYEKFEMKLDDNELILGYLYCSYHHGHSTKTLIESFIQLLSRAIYYNRAQKKAEQLIIMEERATIARELHDSLAQSLSYLKIQVTLLKRVIGKLPEQQHREQSEQIASEIGNGLADAYTQLRELLTTFRLTIKEGNFGEALSTMLEELSERTEAKINLTNNLSSIELDAHSQVHLLQLIREATINAIKHANADLIDVCCIDEEGEVFVVIKDNGDGFDPSSSKMNHYGMSIMQERAARLNGDLTIEAAQGEGCTVILKYKSLKEVKVDDL